jgi:hypothetical protein
MVIHILHSLIIVTGGSARQVGDLVLHIDFLALQQDIDNLSKLQITRAEPAQVTVLMLRLGLHPEEVSLGAGRELQDEDTAICGVLAGRLEGCEATI